MQRQTGVRERGKRGSGGGVYLKLEKKQMREGESETPGDNLKCCRFDHSAACVRLLIYVCITILLRTYSVSALISERPLSTLSGLMK